MWCAYKTNYKLITQITSDYIHAWCLTLSPPVLNIFGFSFFYYHIKYHILNMLKIKSDFKSERFEKNDLHFVKSE